MQLESWRKEASITRTRPMAKKRGARIDSKRRSRVHSTLRTSGFQSQEGCCGMPGGSGGGGQERPRLGEAQKEKPREARPIHFTQRQSDTRESDDCQVKS